MNNEVDRPMLASFGVPQNVLNALAVIDGEATGLTPSQISERTLTSSATMTDTLDALEYNGWVRRVPNPDDRRSVLVEITAQGRAVADRFLPGMRKIELARVNVVRSLRRAIATIAEQAPQLGAHLEESVRTGRYCMYLPDPAAAPCWTVEG